MSERHDMFSRLFGESLITPIKRHMAVCNNAAATLVPFFDAVLPGDFEQANRVRAEICEHERYADSIKREIRLNLPAGLLLSVSRDDLLELVRAQDKIANGCRDLSGLICGRAIRIPEGMWETFRHCVGLAVASVQALNDVIEGLDSLAGSRFMASRTRAVESGLNAVDDRERESDDCEIELRHRLFALEDSMDPVDVMFLYEVIDLVGEVADRAQVVANRLRIILAN